LTKRFYVERKAEQLGDSKQAFDKQDKISNDEKENKLDKQEDINAEFDKIKNK
jgi:hypothetical protein